jgi:hypothetical protein
VKPDPLAITVGFETNRIVQDVVKAGVTLVLFEETEEERQAATS